MIDQALAVILRGTNNSPATPLTPLVPNWYMNAAAEGLVQPYGVFERLANPAIATHDRQVGTRRWLYRFRIYSSDGLIAAQQLEILKTGLIQYTDAPAKGIMRFLQIGGMSDYLQKQRLQGFIADFDIMENIPG